ncbi:MAG TPA: mannose-6-phosphate isomerase [Firmicutes bacterium]|jgi:mannose-6-phosphate isomerase|nr:mannose-6-phosphate isomerase [Bacillota bacterium]
MNDFFRTPLKLIPNRVYRPFIGGKLLDKWQGKSVAKDGQYSEEWVASTVTARSENPIPFEGLSQVCNVAHPGVYLKDLITENPEAFLGKKHTAKFGTSPALLVKVLDSCSRLMIQVHPDQNFARKAFQSEFGKTEAWYVIGGRSIQGENPYVLFGFKPGVTRERWMELFETQNVAGMISALHRFEVKPGDVFLVEGGIPHAAGAGVFFIEVQEPTDYTIRTERITPNRLCLADEQLHQGLGLKKMFDCFHYHGYSREEVLERWHSYESLVHEEQSGKLFSVISPEKCAYFWVERLEIQGKYTKPGTGSFAIAIVLSGSGMIVWEQGSIEVEQACEIFLPAGLTEVTWENQSRAPMVVILCHPPLT